MPDPRLVSTTRERISRNDHHAIFAHGECFRFALRLHVRFGYKLRGVKSHLSEDRRTWSHVWALIDNQHAVDINGVHAEHILAAICGHEGECPENVTPEEVRTLNETRGYPADLESELDQLADRIFDTHERFEKAKPVDSVAYKAFVEDLRRGVNQTSQPTPASRHG